MTIRTIVYLSIICYLSQYEKVEGAYPKLTLKDELEMENELKFLNKPALKSIETEYGDIYDCVDFYKQPAFDHPLLKNHKYEHQQMSPPTKKEMKKVNKSLEIGLPGEGCPNGTVPIRRTTMKDLIRTRLFEQTPGSLRRAVVRTKIVPAKLYNGGQTEISVYRPNVIGNQSSSGVMTLGNGYDNIKVGWTVNPSLYGDGEPRLFIYTITNSTSCYNACSGFVIVNIHIPLGIRFSPPSKRGGPNYDIRFFIYREQVSGRWWLAIGNNEEVIGYWPPRIFNGLKDMASYVEWGGEANVIAGNKGPGMGSSEYPTLYTTFDGYCAKVSTVNEQNEIVDAQNTETFASSHDYDVIDIGMTNTPDRYLIFFGGPGPNK